MNRINSLYRIHFLIYLFVTIFYFIARVDLAYPLVRDSAVPGGGPLVFDLDPTNMPVGLTQAGVEAARVRAMDTWYNDPGSTVKLQKSPLILTVHASPNGCRKNGFPAGYITVPGGEANVAADGVNTIGWSQLPYNILAYTFVRVDGGPGGTIVEVDICFNSSRDNDDDGVSDEDPPGDANGDGCPGVCGVDDDGDGWIDEGAVNNDDEDGWINEDTIEPLRWFEGPGAAPPAPPPYDIETVALHELGHGIGLFHPDVYTTLQRHPNDYRKVVMYSRINAQKRVLRCDDKGGANYSYIPDGVVTESRPLPPNHYPNPGGFPLIIDGGNGVAESAAGGDDNQVVPIDIDVHPYGVIIDPGPNGTLQSVPGGDDRIVVVPFPDWPFEGVNAGGCDFGDAPDPDVGAIMKYPSKERGRPGIDPILVDGELQITRGGRHKDFTMEWLGPMSNPPGTMVWPEPSYDQEATLEPKNSVIPPGRCRDPRPPIRPNRPSVTCEPESMQPPMQGVAEPNRDELDDGMSLRGRLTPGMPTVVDILVNTSGIVPGRYDSNDPDKRLYLNGWEDWNGDQDWDDWTIPFGGMVLPGPGPGPCMAPLQEEYVIWWTGTPTSDNFFTPNFCSGVNIGGVARLLTFVIRPPENMTKKEFYERFRLDYAENVGFNAQAYTDPSLAPVVHAEGTAGVGIDKGEAKYGEVEDYRKPPPTSINLSSFTATVNEWGRVIITWVTGVEIETEGFNILRSSSSSGPFERINPNLILSKSGTPQKSTYLYLDETVKSDTPYHYKLEEVDTKGHQTLYGPVKVLLTTSIPSDNYSSVKDVGSAKPQEAENKKATSNIIKSNANILTSTSDRRQLIYTVVAHEDGSIGIIKDAHDYTGTVSVQTPTSTSTASQVDYSTMTNTIDNLKTSSMTPVLPPNLKDETPSLHRFFPESLAFRIIDIEGNELAVTNGLSEENAPREDGSYQAKWDGNSIIITWYANKPVKSFFVMRRIDGGTSYEKITKIPIPYIEEQSQVFHYTFKDTNVNKGKLYQYRIDALQMDGTTLVGKPIAVPIGIMEKVSIQ